MMNDCIEPERAPSRFAGHHLVQRLREDASWTTGHGAAKSANCDAQLNRATVRWQVEEPPFIAAVHAPRWFAAIATSTATERDRAMTRMRSRSITPSRSIGPLATTSETIRVPWAGILIR